MKRIFNFSEFIKENKKDGIENLPRLSDVVNKEFFSEIKEHIFYWFNYDFLNEKYEITSLENSPTETTVWFDDKGNEPLYEYKVIYTTYNEDINIEKNTNVKMIISIYEYSTTDLLKQTEQKVDIKYLNAKSFNNLINIVKKRILKTPKNISDVEDFRKKEKTNKKKSCN